MCIGIGFSDGGQRLQRPLDGDEVADHLDGLDRSLVGIRPAEYPRPESRQEIT